MLNELLSVEEISKNYGFSKAWVYKRTMEKSIPFYRLGKKIMFRTAEFEAYIEKNLRQEAV